MSNKILIMYAGYKPAKTYGGPVNSISNIIEACKENNEFYVITSNHELNEEKPLDGIEKGWNIVDGARVLYLSKQEENIENMCMEIENLKPDVIYLQSVFLYQYLFASIKYSKKNNVKIVLAPRGELCPNAFALKKAKKQIYMYALRMIKQMRKIIYHSTSVEETKSIANILKIPKSNIKEIPVIPVKTEIKKNTKIKEQNRLKCIFISRITPKKNLLQAIKYVNKAESGVSLDIYGFIEDKAYWQQCIDEMKNTEKVKYCGALEPKEVVEKFREYDLFLFPTLSENYGHVIAESMIAGCPVLISDTTPWNDVADKQSGFVVQLGNDSEFVNVLNKLCNMEEEQFKIIRSKCTEYIKRKIDYSGIAKQYMQLLNKELL